MNLGSGFNGVSQKFMYIQNLRIWHYVEEGSLAVTDKVQDEIILDYTGP